MCGETFHRPCRDYIQQMQLYASISIYIYTHKTIYLNIVASVEYNPSLVYR